jgi:hypothetical protein
MFRIASSPSGATIGPLGNPGAVTFETTLSRIIQKYALSRKNRRESAGKRDTLEKILSVAILCNS